MAQRFEMMPAEQEVKQRRDYTEAMAAAGFDYAHTADRWRSFPFCKRRKVFGLVFRRPRAALTSDCITLHVPLANHEYEKTYLNRLKAANDKELASFGLTDDANANAALRMCL